MLTFVIGIIYGSFLEYFIHKYLFHDMGKAKDSIFAFHLRQHHIVSRRNGFIDTRVSKHEAIGLPIMAVAHIPFYFISPGLYFGMITYALLFLAIHNLVHRLPSLGRRIFWWHWNHHMKNQNKSYNVVLPIADIILGTLESKTS